MPAACVPCPRARSMRAQRDACRSGQPHSLLRGCRAAPQGYCVAPQTGPCSRTETPSPPGTAASASPSLAAPTSAAQAHAPFRALSHLHTHTHACGSCVHAAAGERCAAQQWHNECVPCAAAGEHSSGIRGAARTCELIAVGKHVHDTCTRGCTHACTGSMCVTPTRGEPHKHEREAIIGCAYACTGSMCVAQGPSVCWRSFRSSVRHACCRSMRLRAAVLRTPDDEMHREPPCMPTDAGR
jgi:hypothetical protein